MTCPYCRCENEKDAFFCAQCGSRIAAEPSPRPVPAPPVHTAAPHAVYMSPYAESVHNNRAQREAEKRVHAAYACCAACVAIGVLSFYLGMPQVMVAVLGMTAGIAGVFLAIFAKKHSDYGSPGRIIASCVMGMLICAYRLLTVFSILPNIFSQL